MRIQAPLFLLFLATLLVSLGAFSGDTGKAVEVVDGNTLGAAEILGAVCFGQRLKSRY